MSRRRSRDVVASTDFLIADLRVVLLCALDERHELGRLLRSSVPDAWKMGRDEAWWSDGRGNAVWQHPGIFVEAESMTAAPDAILGRCAACEKRTGERQIQRWTWAQAVARLDSASATGARDTRTSMT
ncbi:hypothetical protein GCM10028777_25010 [Angustibacter speluncae]